jgi:SEC-C motif-containing protein
MTQEICPCGSGNSYDTCCEPIIRGTILAATPEALMRSRYTAYAKQEIKWLLESLEVTQRKDFDEKSVLDWSLKSEWLGLEIRRSQVDENDGKGWVEFLAKFKQQGVVREHHELGEFRQIDGAWFFYDGRGVKSETVKHEKPPVGRNDPCSCGSGKKFKKCCGQ